MAESSHAGFPPPAQVRAQSGTPRAWRKRSLIWAVGGGTIAGFLAGIWFAPQPQRLAAAASSTTPAPLASLAAPAKQPPTPLPLGIEQFTIHDAEVLMIELDAQAWSGRVIPATARAAFLARPDFVLINGGYFDAAGAPDGLLLDGAQSTGRLRSESPYSGFVWAAATGPHQVHIEHRATPPTEPVAWAIQSGPLLVEAGGVLGIRNPGSCVPRTVLALRNTRLVIVRTGPVQLKALAEALIAHGVEIAINLDGGPSSDLQVRLSHAQAADGPAATVIERPGIAPGCEKIPYFLGFAP